MGEIWVIGYHGKLSVRNIQQLLPFSPGKGGWGVKMESVSVKVLTYGLLIPFLVNHSKKQKKFHKEMNGLPRWH